MHGLERHPGVWGLNSVRDEPEKSANASHISPLLTRRAFCKFHGPFCNPAALFLPSFFLSVGCISFLSSVCLLAEQLDCSSDWQTRNGLWGWEGAPERRKASYLAWAQATDHWRACCSGHNTEVGKRWSRGESGLQLIPFSFCFSWQRPSQSCSLSRNWIKRSTVTAAKQSLSIYFLLSFFMLFCLFLPFFNIFLHFSSFIAPLNDLAYFFLHPIFSRVLI